MKKHNILALSLALSLYMAGCSENKVSEYSNLEHKGNSNIIFTDFAESDTIFIDASSTSLEGRWLLHDGKLVFSDMHAVGLRFYDMNGVYLKKEITRGRGPNEMLSPAYVCTSMPDGGMLLMDANWYVHIYDSKFNRKHEPFQLFYDVISDKKNLTRIFNKPDPENTLMYEYELYVQRIRVEDDKLYLPIVTEHVRYNGFETNRNASHFWRDSYIYITMDLETKITGEKFGHYPPLYSQKNIPNFSAQSFDVFKGNIYTTFPADSMIYVRDISGKLKYSTGYSAPGISYNYPQTNTFNDAETNRSRQHKRYGHYSGLTAAGGYIFREYQKDADNGYGMQIYRGNDLVGDIALEDPLEILGAYGQYFMRSVM